MCEHICTGERGSFGVIGGDDVGGRIVQTAVEFIWR